MNKTTMDPQVAKLLWRAFSFAASTKPILVYDVPLSNQDRQELAKQAKRYGDKR